MSVCDIFSKRPQWWHPKKVMVLQLQHTSKRIQKQLNLWDVFPIAWGAPCCPCFPYLTPNNVGSWAPFFSIDLDSEDLQWMRGARYFDVPFGLVEVGQLRPNDPSLHIQQVTVRVNNKSAGSFFLNQKCFVYLFLVLLLSDVRGSTPLRVLTIHLPPDHQRWEVAHHHWCHRVEGDYHL